MTVRHFLEGIRAASAAQRVEATSALARAYLHSDLSKDDAAAAEHALLMVLDDPSPLVRRALADALAASPNSPPAVVLALAADQPQISGPVLALSPLFVDADLVDAVATGPEPVQAAIASRAGLPRSVAGAIAEVGAAKACLVLVGNSAAQIAPLSIDRMVERFGHVPAIREALLARDDIAPSTRLALVAKLSETLVVFVAKRRWLDAARARVVAREACEKATVTVAAETPTAQIRSLVSHLRASGQLTAGLILRAFLSGNVKLFEEALAELSEMPAKRVRTVVHYGGGASLRALFERAGLPPSTYPAFKQAIEAMREGDLMSEPGGSARLKRRMIERVLTGCEKEALDELAPLLTLLRRFATEAARGIWCPAAMTKWRYFLTSPAELLMPRAGSVLDVLDHDAVVDLGDARRGPCGGRLRLPLLAEAAYRPAQGDAAVVRRYGDRPAVHLRVPAKLGGDVELQVIVRHGCLLSAIAADPEGSPGDHGTTVRTSGQASNPRNA